MRLRLEKIKVSNGITNLIVVDEDNFNLPFSEINNFMKEYDNLSLNRRRTYAYGLINFFEWLDINNLQYLTVSKNNITQYIQYLREEPDKRHKIWRILKNEENVFAKDYKTKLDETINAQISIIRRYYEFLKKRNIALGNPCELNNLKIRGYGNVGLLAHTKNKKLKIDTMKLKKSRCFDIDEYISEQKISDKEPFTYEEVQQIFDLLKNPQEVLLISMLFLGLRISEALWRRTNDIRWADRIIKIIYHEGDPPDGIIKNHSVREVPISNVLYFSNLLETMKEAYNQYVLETLRPKKTENTMNFLFINLRGKVKQLEYENIYKRIIKNNLQKNLNRQVNFHSFRHHWATTNIALGMSLANVQINLGHKNLSTTINDYYNPSIRFIKDLVAQGLITEGDAEERVNYLNDYKKKFCKKV